MQGAEDHNTSRCRIVVCADDFGMSPDINRAIVLAFERRLISDASIMVNMPGFAAACDLADLHRLHGSIGLHLNLSEGRPVSEAIRSHARFCEPNGAFRRRRTMARLSSRETQAVEREVEAQIEACRRRGLGLTHIDSHHHFHTEWPIGAIVMKVARRYGIERVRMARNCGERLGVVRRLYKLAYNSRLRASGLTNACYFGAVDHVVPVAPTVRGICEVNVHPGLDERGALVDRLTGEELESVVCRLRRVGTIEAVRETPALATEATATVGLDGLGNTAREISNGGIG